MSCHSLHLYCRRREPCPKLAEFLQEKGITFASVDIRSDKEKLAHEDITIPEQYHIDIQDMFKTKERFH